MNGVFDRVNELYTESFGGTEDFGSFHGGWLRVAVAILAMLMVFEIVAFGKVLDDGGTNWRGDRPSRNIIREQDEEESKGATEKQ